MIVLVDKMVAEKIDLEDFKGRPLKIGILPRRRLKIVLITKTKSPSSEISIHWELEGTFVDHFKKINGSDIIPLKSVEEAEDVFDTIKRTKMIPHKIRAILVKKVLEEVKREKEMYKYEEKE